MHDYGNEAAEKAINELNKKVQDVYKEAEKDLQKKMDEFVRKYKVKEQKYLEQVAEGKISQADFDAWKRGQVFQGRQWRTKQRSIADVLYRSGEVSTKIINEMALGVCAENVNWAAYTIEHGFGVNFGFNLYDETTVANLIKKEPDILPKWKIDEKKNYIWNKKKMNNAVTQGIIQGEKLDEIAKRVAVGLSGSDQNLMKTFAKTAMTGAQNSGRNISYKNAQKLGINLKKEWLATLDMRTRSSHRKLDGKKADIDEPFESEFGEIMYPGDPSANAADVYNCRCTMVADLIDYPAEEYERYDNIDGKPIKGMSYEEWAKAKGYAKKDSSANNKAKEEVASHHVVNGKNILSTWTRRPDMFEFEIEDALNAQGFDGLPRVVNGEEFDELVKQANNGEGFIAQRTYSAPDQETLDAYRDQLYNGKWYVDCSTGGAQYGQGMYCAADYTGTITDGMREEMKHYKDINLLLNDDDSRVTYFQLAQDMEKSRYKQLSGKEYDPQNYNERIMQQARQEVRKYMSLDSTTVESSVKDFDLHYKFSKSYTETFTLTPDAKILRIEDSEDVKNFIADEYAMSKVTKQKEKEVLSQYSAIQKEFEPLARAQATKENDEKLRKLYNEREKLISENPSEWNTIDKYRNEFFSEYSDKDPGVVASLAGYDAIDATGHGASGSYTVILNRTKVIFKGE